VRALLRADLAALANALRLGEGRRALAANLVGSAFLALGSFTIGGRILLSKPVRQALAEDPARAAPRWMTVVALGAIALASWSAFGAARALLFRTERAELLLTSPAPRTAIVAHAWLRALAATVALACVVAWPLLFGLVARTPASPGAAVVFPLVAALAAAPAVALVLLGVVLARRFLSDPRLRVLLNVVGAVSGLATMLAIGAGVVAGGTEQRALAHTLAAAGAAPGWAEAPGRVLAAAAGITGGWEAAPTLLVLLLAAVPPLLVAALLHGRAYEASLALRSRARTLAPRARRWPRGVVASVVRKDLAVTFQTRSSFAGFAFLGCAALLFLSSELFESLRVRAEAAPPQPSLLLGLVMVWTLLLMMLATLQGGAFFTDELKRAELLATAPIRRADLLLGKLPALVLPYAWLLAVLLAGAPSIRGADLATCALFAAAAVPAAAVSIGILMALGSAPALQRGEQSVLKFLASAVAVGLPNIALLVALHDLRRALGGHYAAHADAGLFCAPLAVRLAVLWIAGLTLLALGWRVSVRHVERLFGPRP
jgi:hypothetical protein